MFLPCYKLGMSTFAADGSASWVAADLASALVGRQPVSEVGEV